MDKWNPFSRDFRKDSTCIVDILWLMDYYFLEYDTIHERTVGEKLWKTLSYISYNGSVVSKPFLLLAQLILHETGKGNFAGGEAF